MKKKSSRYLFSLQRYVVKTMKFWATLALFSIRKITGIQNGKKWLFYRIFRGSIILNSKIDVLRKQKKSTDLKSQDVNFSPFSYWPIVLEKINICAYSVFNNFFYKKITIMKIIAI